MNYEILCIFMMMVGEMQERMDRCIKYAKERQAFGRSIGSNQYIAGKIVDMKIGLENSRKHLYDTARRFNRGRSVTTEISMAKLITSEANVASALSAIQIFGARGYTREYGLEKGLRDAIGAPIYSGHERDPAGPDRLDARTVRPSLVWQQPNKRTTGDLPEQNCGILRMQFDGTCRMCTGIQSATFLALTGLRRGCAGRVKTHIDRA